MIILFMQKPPPPPKKMGRWKGRSIFFGESVLWTFKRFSFNIQYFISTAYNLFLIHCDVLTQIFLCILFLKVCWGNLQYFEELQDSPRMLASITLPHQTCLVTVCLPTNRMQRCASLGLSLRRAILKLKNLYFLEVFFLNIWHMFIYLKVFTF